MTMFLDKPSGVDPGKVKIEIQAPPSDEVRHRSSAHHRRTKRPEDNKKAPPLPAGLFLVCLSS